MILEFQGSGTVIGACEASGAVFGWRRESVAACWHAALLVVTTCAGYNRS